MEFHVKKSQGSTFLPNTSADFPDSPGSESAAFARQKPVFDSSKGWFHVKIHHGGQAIIANLRLVNYG